MKPLIVALSVVLAPPVFAHVSQANGAAHWLEHWLPLGIAIPLLGLVLIRRLRQKGSKH